MYADAVCMRIDGSLQTMLEEAGQRSEDGDEGRMRLLSLLRALIYLGR